MCTCICLCICMSICACVCPYANVYDDTRNENIMAFQPEMLFFLSVHIIYAYGRLLELQYFNIFWFQSNLNTGLAHAHHAPCLHMAKHQTVADREWAGAVLITILDISKFIWRLKFHSLSPMNIHCFRYHYLNQWWPSLLTHICVTWS